MSHRLAELRWPDVTAGSLLAVPSGSCEQHGPHLPLDTDTLLAVSFADALAARRGDVVVSPPITVGASGEHAGFPGTLSIGTPTMRDTALELARSALPHGGPEVHSGPFEGVLFVNAHGGNAEALAEAVGILTSEGRDVAVWHPRVSEGDSHAGHTETSLMLHLHPARVRMDLAEVGSPARFSEIGNRLRSHGLAAVTPNGILGDPTTADAEQGGEIFERLADDLAAAAQLLRPAPGTAT